MRRLEHALAETAPSALCRTAFLVAAASVLSLSLLPRHVRGLLMDYGPRRRGADPRSSPARSAVDAVASCGQVPHSWFWHFYLGSVGLSALWAWQYASRGRVMALVAEAQARRSSGQPSVELGRVCLAWLMMAAQGSRRLLECLVVIKPGKTPMWIVHWAVGLAFYAAMSVSVWIEGSEAIVESWRHFPDPVSPLTPRVSLALAVFAAAWFKQNQCHRYLASLQKYTLPSKGMFRYLVCPHYTCECVLYLAISCAAAPPGQLFNRTILCGVSFVAVNLGVTAAGTKQWYAGKFGASKVASRWRMIPGVF
ncbi:uncharacterized protein UV8b_02889 [Ustilaginoidea virens]|uniref:Polyprenal reductase n=1 Tax=Ustilaginoidea virens TaxID=1159556 RepID=A0A8E5MFP9_USTVR|nr:uncharacterized protein UV8b_02889 [Ustilaginoidea virens]QUC18648.1 hypothetical protein UV8b_02889 [Ustilaginoidea virens]